MEVDNKRKKKRKVTTIILKKITYLDYIKPLQDIHGHISISI